MRYSIIYIIIFGLISVNGLANSSAIADCKNQSCFYENKGQIRDQYGRIRTDIDFVICTADMSMFVGNGKIEYQFFQIKSKAKSSGLSKHPIPQFHEADMYRVDMELLSVSPNARISREDKKNASINFVNTTVKTNNAISAFGKITYKDVYKGIDWVIYTKNGNVKYEFIVHPGGNVSDIKLKYGGASSLKLEADGNFMAENPLGIIKENKPVSFQENGAPVASAFVLNNDLLSFSVAPYNGVLIIDPAISWSTYFGGQGHERYTDIIPDSLGHIYACGYTSSLTNVATTGAYQNTFGGVFDGLVSKFDTSGTLIWSTYYGSTGGQYLFGISTVDTSVYVTGETVNNNDHNVLLVKFNNSGQWIWDRTYGTFGFDQAEVVINDPWENIYVAGTTESPGMATPGAFQTVQGQTGDAFLMKVDPAGNTIWSTYYGDAGFDEFDDLRLDGAGNIIGVGGSMSSGLNTMSPSYAGGSDAILFSFDTAGARLWCRYFGSSGGDYAYALDFDATGNIFIAGSTNSTIGLVAGANPYQSVMTGFPATDAFLAKFDNTGQTIWATYFGGSAFDIAASLEVTSGGNVLFGGNTVSTSGIASGNAIQPTFGGGSQDGFIALFSGAGSNIWSTYFGGNGVDNLFSVALDKSDEIYAAGYSESTTGISTPLSYQPTYNANGDAFLTELTDCTPVAMISSISGLGTLCSGEVAAYSITPVSGATTYTWTIPSGFIGTSNTNIINVTAGMTGGSISVTASNNCSNTQASTLTIAVNAPGNAAIVPILNPALCQGDSIVLFATITGMTYQWLLNGSPIAGSVNDTLHVLSAGNYELVTNLGSLCADTSVAVTITASPLPQMPGPINGSQTVCQDSSAIYTVANDPNVTSYTWTLPPGWAGLSSTNSITVTPGTSAGVISAVANNNCGQSSAQSIAVSSSPAPVVVINAFGSLVFTTNIFNTYQWYYNGNLIPGATNQSYTWSAPGTYYVIVFDGVCSAKSNALTLPLTGLETVNVSNQLNIYPNPNNGRFVVSLPFTGNGPLILDIVNLHGQSVYTTKVAVNSQSSIDIQTDNMAAGVYLLKLQMADIQITKPFVIN